MIDEDTHAHLTPEAILTCWSGINERSIAETHLAWGVLDDKTAPVEGRISHEMMSHEGARKADRAVSGTNR